MRVLLEKSASSDKVYIGNQSKIPMCTFNKGFMLDNILSLLLRHMFSVGHAFAF